MLVFFFSFLIHSLFINEQCVCMCVGVCMHDNHLLNIIFFYFFWYTTAYCICSTKHIAFDLDFSRDQLSYFENWTNFTHLCRFQTRFFLLNLFQWNFFLTWNPIGILKFVDFFYILDFFVQRLFRRGKEKYELIQNFNSIKKLDSSWS